MFGPDFIGIYDNALPSPQCKEVIQWIETQSLSKGLGYGLKGKLQYNPKYKDSWDISNNFSNKNFVDLKIRHVLNKYTTSYRDSYPSLDLLDPWMVYDAYNIQKYDPGGAYHLIHCENCGGPNDIKRVMAWMIYLNTVTDKGGTYFSSYNKTIKAKEGRLVIWPAYFTHPHKGVVSKTQTKYIATGWYNFVN